MKVESHLYEVLMWIQVRLEIHTTTCELVKSLQGRAEHLLDLLFICLSVLERSLKTLRI